MIKARKVGDLASRPLVVIEPENVLNFKAVDSNNVAAATAVKKASATLSIQNISQAPVIFKFKTNASKTLLNANPCWGEIAPRTSLDISINIRFKSRAELDNVKVMVATAPLPPNAGNKDDIKALWALVSTQDVSEKKLRCVLLETGLVSSTLNEGLCNYLPTFAPQDFGDNSVASTQYVDMAEGNNFDTTKLIQLCFFVIFGIGFAQVFLCWKMWNI